MKLLSILTKSRFLILRLLVCPYSKTLISFVYVSRRIIRFFLPLALGDSIRKLCLLLEL